MSEEHQGPSEEGLPKDLEYLNELAREMKDIEFTDVQAGETTFFESEEDYRQQEQTTTPQSVETVIILSPFASDTDALKHHYGALLDAAMRYALKHSIVPFAGHALYPTYLDDKDPRARLIGFGAAWEVGRRLDKVWLVLDNMKMTNGMAYDLVYYSYLNKPIHVFNAIHNDDGTVDLVELHPRDLEEQLNV